MDVCRGVRGERVVLGGVVGARWVLRCAGPQAGFYPAGPGRALVAVSRLVKVSAHGHRRGMRRVCRPERLTATAGIAVMRVRNVTLVTVG